MAIFISEKIDFKTRNTRNKEGRVIIIKRPLHQEDIMIIIIHAPNNRLKICEEKDISKDI